MTDLSPNLCIRIDNAVLPHFRQRFSERFFCQRKALPELLTFRFKPLYISFHLFCSSFTWLNSPDTLSSLPFSIRVIPHPVSAMFLPPVLPVYPTSLNTSTLQNLYFAAMLLLLPTISNVHHQYPSRMALLRLTLIERKWSGTIKMQFNLYSFWGTLPSIRIIVKNTLNSICNVHDSLYFQLPNLLITTNSQI